MHSKFPRVVDAIIPPNTSESTMGNPVYRDNVNTYDKNFSFLVLCSRYDEAHASQNTALADELREAIYVLLDSAYAAFAEAINQGNSDLTLGGNTLKGYLELIAEEIRQAKEAKKDPRELMEIALIKLSMLQDLSTSYSDENFYQKFQKTCYESLRGTVPYNNCIDFYINRLMNLSLNDDIKTIRRAIGMGFSQPSNLADLEEYINTQSILPFFSQRASIGFNTILCAIFNDYLPVGFGVYPWAVHSNYLEQESWTTVRHDYGHCMARVSGFKLADPDLFNYCKYTYFNLFNEINAKEIDEKTFKKELLILFFMVYEYGNFGFGSYNEKLMEDEIIRRTHDVGERASKVMMHFNLEKASKDAETYLKRKTLLKSDRPVLDEKEKENIRKGLNLLTTLETIDFVKPLQDLGYKFPDDVAKRPWKAGPALRVALLELFNEFKARHPNFFSTAHQIATLQNNTQSITPAFSFFDVEKSERRESTEQVTQDLKLGGK